MFAFRKWWYLPALLWLVTNIGFAQPGESGTLLYVDGQNILPGSSYPLHQDDLVRFEAYNLLPGSKVTILARRKRIKVHEETYVANERGELKQVLFFPKATGEIWCSVLYQGPDEKEKKVVFFLEKYGRGRKDASGSNKTGQ